MLIILLISVLFNFYYYSKNSELITHKDKLIHENTLADDEIDKYSKQIDYLNHEISQLDIKEKMDFLELWQKRIQQLKKAQQ